MSHGADSPAVVGSAATAPSEFVSANSNPGFAPGPTTPLASAPVGNGTTHGSELYSERHESPPPSNQGGPPANPAGSTEYAMYYDDEGQPFLCDSNGVRYTLSAVGPSSDRHSRSPPSGVPMHHSVLFSTEPRLSWLMEELRACLLTAEYLRDESRATVMAKQTAQAEARPLMYQAKAFPSLIHPFDENEATKEAENPNAEAIRGEVGLSPFRDISPTRRVELVEGASATELEEEPATPLELNRMVMESFDSTIMDVPISPDTSDEVLFTSVRMTGASTAERIITLVDKHGNVYWKSQELPPHHFLHPRFGGVHRRAVNTATIEHGRTQGDLGYTDEELLVLSAPKEGRTRYGIPDGEPYLLPGVVFHDRIASLGPKSDDMNALPGFRVQFMAAQVEHSGHIRHTEDVG
ncbi:hypothetical protein DFH06DRAFT_1152382 [Mycena polygramma]|nr:hypothetical protein DFH06DRAFT_1152382 [Mycena polygramma]